MVTVFENGAEAEPRQPRTEAMDFVLGELRANPELTFTELKAKAQLNGLEVFPILYGRARKILGITGEAGSRPESSTAPSVGEAAPSASTSEPTAEPVRARGRTLGPLMKLATDMLAADPGCTNAELRQAAARAGLTMDPATLVRARKRLGVAGPRRRTPDQALDDRSAARPKPTSPTARSTKPMRAASTVPFSVEELVAYIRDVEQERDRMRGALEQLARTIEEALSS